ncbi:hypothetical protein IE81DRAFT_350489 [Ceraceosorus guamensis]|uniref:Uncharacterized protein n=1 Tax=Ceraceosorus guamensis TaxID=1522189 RepID=A0A316VP44_9BASI|nr:hypothetical protein IE81DRAFT_350489 [Ceraceosorus guamensis]PWN39084.1 hypothetical protein IE81DRAFT_350489 [Ceraceosorus guamensis]
MDLFQPAAPEARTPALKLSAWLNAFTITYVEHFIATKRYAAERCLRQAYEDRVTHLQQRTNRPGLAQRFDAAMAGCFQVFVGHVTCGSLAGRHPNSAYFWWVNLGRAARIHLYKSDIDLEAAPGGCFLFWSGEPWSKCQHWDAEEDDNGPVMSVVGYMRVGGLGKAGGLTDMHKQCFVEMESCARRIMDAGKRAFGKAPAFMRDVNKTKKARQAEQREQDEEEAKEAGAGAGAEAAGEGSMRKRMKKRSEQKGSCGRGAPFRPIPDVPLAQASTQEVTSPASSAPAGAGPSTQNITSPIDFPACGRPALRGSIAALSSLSPPPPLPPPPVASSSSLPLPPPLDTPLNTRMASSDDHVNEDGMRVCSLSEHGGPQEATSEGWAPRPPRSMGRSEEPTCITGLTMLGQSFVTF